MTNPSPADQWRRLGIESEATSQPRPHSPRWRPRQHREAARSQMNLDRRRRRPSLGTGLGAARTHSACLNFPGHHKRPPHCRCRRLARARRRQARVKILVVPGFPSFRHGSVESHRRSQTFLIEQYVLGLGDEDAGLSINMSILANSNSQPSTRPAPPSTLVRAK